jgi:hypothetical protein
MEYTWKHGIQSSSNYTFKTEHTVEVKQILVDLCTGDKYQVLSVSKLRDRTKRPVLQTWDAGRCTAEQIAYFRKETNYVPTEDCKPFQDIASAEWKNKVKAPDGQGAL